MRPVRFVALSEDGQALVLADEVGRLLALPLDDRINGALHTDGHAAFLEPRRTACNALSMRFRLSIPAKIIFAGQ